MSIEQQLRDHYRAAPDDTGDLVGGPDLGTVIHRGRRRRRTRATGLVGAAVAVVGAGAMVAALTTGGGAPTTVTDPNNGPGPAAAAEDFVPGTEIDATLQQVVAEHLPALGAPTDVYPSDWYHDGPMLDEEYAGATDWQAAYRVDESERLLVVMGYPMPDEPTACPSCHRSTVPEGTLMTQVSWLEDAGEWVFLTSLVRDDGFAVNLIDYVVSPELSDARAQRAVSNAEAAELLRDPRMHFPEPQEPPTGS